MNNKQKELNKILDTVVECCSFESDDDIITVSRDDVIGKSRKQNIVMARCMVALNIVSFGYSVSTCATFLHRTEHAVRDMIVNAHSLLETSRAFRIANAEVTIKLKEE